MRIQIERTRNVCDASLPFRGTLGTTNARGKQEFRPGRALLYLPRHVDQLPHAHELLGVLLPQALGDVAPEGLLPQHEPRDKLVVRAGAMVVAVVVVRAREVREVRRRRRRGHAGIELRLEKKGAPYGVMAYVTWGE